MNKKLLPNIEDTLSYIKERISQLVLMLSGSNPFSKQTNYSEGKYDAFVIVESLLSKAMDEDKKLLNQ